MLMLYLSILPDEDKTLFEQFYEENKYRCLYIALKMTSDQTMAEDAIHDSFLIDEARILHAKALISQEEVLEHQEVWNRLGI